MGEFYRELIRRDQGTLLLFTLFMMLEPAARHSAPNHSCPPRLSVTISSGNFCLNSLVALPPGPSSSSNIRLQMLSNLSWQERSLDTREAQRSGSFRPSKESSSAATRLRLSSAYLSCVTTLTNIGL